VQVRPADVADQQRVAAEDEPRLLVAAAPVRDYIGVVRRRVPGCVERRDDRVAELDPIAVGERDVIELDSGAGGKIRRRFRRLDERRQARDVIRLHVRLEHGDDRSPDRSCDCQIFVDEVGVRIDDREAAVHRAAEQIAGARAVVVQERA
jgi:hypothetical protein